MRAIPSFAVYVHIPICAHKCYYCDFHSRPAGPTDRARYLTALRAEIETCPQKGARATSLFIGGGTPSELTGDEIELLVGTLVDTFLFEMDAEWTIECNPGTVSPASCDRLLECGFDRVSIGVQSFNDGHLKRIGRIHSANDAVRCVDWFRGAGFENIGLDLLFGLPGQSLRDWKRDLRKALELEPEHLSLYSLSIEPGTPFGHLRDTGSLREVPDDVVAGMYEAGMEMASRAGYQQYEISNFALPGFQCSHNLAYWSNSPYLGFGVSAASYVEGVRWSNTHDWQVYFESAGKGAIPRLNQEKLPWNEALGEEIMLGLRTAQGISFARLSRKYRCDCEGIFRCSIDFLTEQALVVQDGDRLSLTRRGKLLANEVCREFLSSARALDSQPEA